MAEFTCAVTWDKDRNAMELVGRRFTNTKDRDDFLVLLNALGGGNCVLPMRWEGVPEFKIFTVTWL